MEDYIFYGVMGLLATIVLGILLAVSCTVVRQNQILLKECMDDGKPRYECVAMLRGGRH